MGSNILISVLEMFGGEYISPGKKNKSKNKQNYVKQKKPCCEGNQQQN